MKVLFWDIHITESGKTDSKRINFVGTRWYVLSRDFPSVKFLHIITYISFRGHTFETVPFLIFVYTHFFIYPRKKLPSYLLTVAKCVVVLHRNGELENARNLLVYVKGSNERFSQLFSKFAQRRVIFQVNFFLFPNNLLNWKLKLMPTKREAFISIFRWATSKLEKFDDEWRAKVNHRYVLT